MMKRKSFAIEPVSTPTLNGLESQEKLAAAMATSTAAVSGLTSIHVTALDGIVSVNSLFTASLFIGLSMTMPEKSTTVLRAACTATPETVRQLIVYEVLSFSFFLFSSLIAQSLKLTINLSKNEDAQRAKIGVKHLKYCLFGSTVGSVLGCTFLMLSIVDFIRVKLGSLSCGGKPVYAVVTLLVFVGSGLVVYVITAGFAAFSIQEKVVKYEEKEKEEEAIVAAAVVRSIN